MKEKFDSTEIRWRIIKRKDKQQSRCLAQTSELQQQIYMEGETDLVEQVEIGKEEEITGTEANRALLMLIKQVKIK